MIGRALLGALLGLSLWTAAVRAVEAVLPPPVVAAAAAACVDVPQPDDGPHRAWNVPPGHAAPLSSSDTKSQPRVAAFALAPSAPASRLAHPQLARPAPAPAAVAHLHAIPLLI